ncbi:MAG: class I SAM-dependent methyltransferase [Candidatus Aenigmatarchaeota archaeon]|nr:class I SAM-dependent methyltransferase [Candidatus Aenigmarchaeota archaeon]
MKSLRQTYDEIAESWSNFRAKPALYIPFGIFKGSTIDIGCGNCRNLIPIAKKGYRCVGVDFSKNMIKQARKMIGKNNVDIDLIIADAKALPLKDKTFDFIFCAATLHHLVNDDRIKALKEMKRIARKKIFLSVWYRWQLIHVKNLLKNIFSFGDVYVEWRKGGNRLKRYYHLYTKRELEKDIQAADLEIESIKITKEPKKNIIAICKVKK